MRVVEKPEALRLLEAYKQSLGASDGGTAPALRGGASDCVLCALARSEACAQHAIAESADGFVLLNRFAQRRGHLMVLPRAHAEHVHELSWPVYAGLQRLAYDAGIALQRALSPVRVWNAVLGAAAPLPASFAHVHVHVIPIYESDERARPARVLSWSEGVTVYDDAEAVALSAELRAAWPGSGRP